MNKIRKPSYTLEERKKCHVIRAHQIRLRYFIKMYKDNKTDVYRDKCYKSYYEFIESTKILNGKYIPKADYLQQIKDICPET